MKIEHETSERGGSFYVDDAGDRLGELTYRLTGKDRMTIDHTEVAEELQGQGVARELVASAVAFARRERYRVTPLCPYAKNVIEKTKEFQEVLAK